MASSAPTDIQTKLKYLQWQASYTHTRPYRIAQFGRKRKNDQKQKSHNLVFAEGDDMEIIRDIRGAEGKGDPTFTLDGNGFVYRKYPPPLFTDPKEFAAPDHIQKVFLPQCEAMLKNEIEGVERVLIFDWKVSDNRASRPSVGLAVNHLLRLDKEEEKCKGAAKEESRYTKLCATSAYR